MTTFLAPPDSADVIASSDTATEQGAAHERDAGRPTPPSGRGHGGSLTKITVNLVPRAFSALEEVSAITGDTKTDSINRAIQLYAWVHKMLDAGESVRVVSPDGKIREIQIF